MKISLLHKPNKDNKKESPLFVRVRGLESLVRGWGEKFDIFVSTAGVLSSDNLGAIGGNRVTIPSKYYKVINLKKKKRVIIF